MKNEALQMMQVINNFLTPVFIMALIMAVLRLERKIEAIEKKVTK